jgi:ribosomal-protein-alanine N-acetyltransferase
MRWWDIEDVHALEVAVFPDDAWSVEQFWSELAQPSRDYRVAERDGQVVGYGGTSTLAPDSDLQTIAVAPEAQGTGVAPALLAVLLAGAADRGGRRIVLEVRADNVRAQALYTRFGFAQIARRARYYPDGGDALIWQARLEPPAGAVSPQEVSVGEPCSGRTGDSS